MAQIAARLMPAQEERLFISKLLFPAFRIPGQSPNCIGVVRTLHEPERPWQLKMKAIVLTRYGGPDVLELRDVPTPTPTADQVLVRVHAASLNDWDWEMLRGQSLVARLLHGLFRPKVHIIGCDIAGRVAAVGEQVKTLRVGDEVYGDLCMQGFGAFAEYACAPEACLAHKPASMTFEQAAAIPQAGMLAVQVLIDVGRIRQGQKVLLNGAGGASVRSAFKSPRLHNAEVTAVDKAEKLDTLRALAPIASSTTAGKTSRETGSLTI